MMDGTVSVTIGSKPDGEISKSRPDVVVGLSLSMLVDVPVPAGSGWNASWRILVALRSLGLGVGSAVEINGLVVRVLGKCCIFMVLKGWGLCCSTTAVVVFVELCCNGADDPGDWAVTGKEPGSIDSVCPTLALCERPGVLGSLSDPKRPTLLTCGYG